MLSYSEIMDRLSEMRSRYDDGFSSSDRVFINEVHGLLFGHPVKNLGCPNCYRDAYIEVTLKLRKMKEMPKKKNFVLRSGVLLHAFNGEVFTNANLTDEIAMDALNENRGRFDLFAKVPDNWEALCKARKAIMEKESARKSSISREELQDSVDSLKVAVDAAKKDLEEANAKLESANQELATQTAKLEEVQKEAEASREALEKARLSFEDELKGKNDEIVSLTRQKNALESANQELATQTAKLEAKVAVLETELEKSKDNSEENVQETKASTAQASKKKADASPKSK
ncbi:MAG: hypothetical protein IJM04_04315 [Prevotella sp.]|nr:hypothetical protein [Prevotella sp.]